MRKRRCGAPVFRIWTRRVLEDENSGVLYAPASTLGRLAMRCKDALFGRECCLATPMALDPDVWHFIYNDAERTWTWRRSSPAGDTIAASAFSFQSYNVCLADAERAGYVSDAMPVRRHHAADPAASAAEANVDNERRRRPRILGTLPPSFREGD